MYTLLKEDENTTKLMVVGYSVLNIFVESGTTEQPEKDDIASTVRLMLATDISMSSSVADDT